MTAHELARILAAGPDAPAVLVLPGVRIEAQACYYVEQARFLPVDGLYEIGPAVLIGCPSDPAFQAQTGESVSRSTPSPGSGL